MSTPKISLIAIIPAYNEASTVGTVVAVAKRHPALQDVIVVDDGSQDKTAAIASSAGARVVGLSPNRGKAEAMECGVVAAPHATHFLFLDADLKGLTPDHISTLIAPIATGAAMSIGMRDRGAVLTALNISCLPWISGERVVSRELWEAVPQEFKHGFQIELALNATARRRGDHITTVELSGLSIIRKEQKVGLYRGLWKRAAMTAELIAVSVRLMLR